MRIRVAQVVVGLALVAGVSLLITRLVPPEDEVELTYASGEGKAKSETATRSTSNEQKVSSKPAQEKKATSEESSQPQSIEEKIPENRRLFQNLHEKSLLNYAAYQP